MASSYIKRRLRRPDAQAVDKVVIKTEPRFKLSLGREWRIGARTEYYLKDRLVYTEHHGNVKSALDHASETYEKPEFWTACDKINVEDLCDQEGCSQPFDAAYQVKDQRCVHCGSHEAPDPVSPNVKDVRKFCQAHSDRGDLSWNDSNDNYILISDETVQQ